MADNLTCKAGDRVRTQRGDVQTVGDFIYTGPLDESEYKVIEVAHYAPPGVAMIAMTPGRVSMIDDVMQRLGDRDKALLRSALGVYDEPAKTLEPSSAVELRLSHDGYDVRSFDGKGWTGTVLAESDADVFVDVGRQHAIKVPIPPTVGHDHIPAVGSVVKVSDRGEISSRDPALTLESDRGA